MKLEISAIQTAGKTEIILPQYMHSLLQEEIDYIRKNEKTNRIIACGYHKKTHNIMLIDVMGSISEINVADFFQHFIIVDHAFPIEGGEKIEVHTPIMIIEVDSIDLLSASSPVDSSDFEIVMKS